MRAKRGLGAPFGRHTEPIARFDLVGERSEHASGCGVLFGAHRNTQIAKPIARAHDPMSIAGRMTTRKIMVAAASSM
jgi:hypothetical protein